MASLPANALALETLQHLCRAQQGAWNLMASFPEGTPGRDEAMSFHGALSKLRERAHDIELAARGEKPFREPVNG